MATKASRIALAGSNISSTGEVDADLLDNTDSSAFLSLDGNGRLGIGTSSPAEKVEVNGSFKVGNLKIQNANGGRIGFNRNTANGDIYDSNFAAFQINGAYANADFMAFEAYTSGGVGTDAMAIRDNGNVGIGVTNPGEKLDVDGDIRVRGSGSTIGGANMANSALLIGSTTTGIGIDANEIYGKGGPLYIGVLDAEDIHFRYGINKIATMQSSGNVGIGTSSPTERLHVSSGSFKIDTDTNSTFKISDAGTNAIALYGGTGDELYMGANNAYSLRFKTDGNIVMDNGGNLGIGTASPGNLLEISQDVTTQYTTSAALSNVANNPINFVKLTNSNTSITTPEVNILFTAGASGSGQHSIGVRRSGTNTGDMIFRRRSGGATSAETMRIDSSGYVHMPAQPVALYYDPVDTNPSEGDIIQFTVKAGLTRGITDSNSKSRFTVPADGIYGVSCTVAGSVTTTSAGDGLRILIKRSGVTYASLNAYNIETAGTEVGMEWTFKEMMLVNLTAGQYIELQWNNVGGTAFTMKYGNINIWKVA